MTDVFISYSRKDKAFVQTLHAALKHSHHHVWVDWQDIPVTADWWQEVQRGIEGANTFVFVISPDSVTSSVCYREIEHSLHNNKRLVPILRREGFAISQLHPSLSKHNWLLFREDDDFDSAFHALVKALDTDLLHVRAHTRLLVRALEWEEKGYNESFLLRGMDLKDAEYWLEQSPGKDPKPTEQQVVYIQKSREAEDASFKLISVGQRARKAARIAAVVLGITLGSLGLIAMLAYRTTQAMKVAQQSLIKAEQREKQLQEKAEVAIASAKEEQMRLLELTGEEALRQFNFDPLSALIAAVRNGQQLQDLIESDRPSDETSTPVPVATLRTILDNIQVRNRIQAHQGGISEVSFSADGSQIVTAGSDGKVRLWNSSGKRLGEFSVPEGVQRLSLSPDGALIATVGNDSTIRLWNRSGESQAVLAGSLGVVRSIRFSPDSQQIAAAGGDGRIRLWDRSGQLQADFEGHPESIFSIDFSPNGEQLITAGKDGTIRLWNLSGDLLERFQGSQESMSSVSFSPDAQQIVSIGESGKIYLWNPSGQLVDSFQGHQGQITAGQFSLNGKLLATARDNTLRLWTSTGQLVQILRSPQGVISDVTFSPDGNQIVMADSNGAIWFWDVFSPQMTRFISQPSRVEQVGFSADGQQLATIGSDGTARVWNSSGDASVELRALQGRINSVSFSPDGKAIATAGSDGVVRIWDETGKLLTSLRGHRGSVQSVLFSPIRGHLVTAGEDGTVRLWTLTNQQFTAIQAFEQTVAGLALNLNGQLVAAVGDETVQVWNWSGRRLFEIDEAPIEPSSVRFNPDENQLAIATQDKIRILDRSGELVRELAMPPGTINSLSFSHDGRTLATVDTGAGTVRLWSLTGQRPEQLTEFRGQQGSIASVSFSPDDRLVALAGTDGSIRVLKNEALDLNQLIERSCLWLSDYLANGTEVSDRDRQVCDGIATSD